MHRVRDLLVLYDALRLTAVQQWLSSDSTVWWSCMFSS